jgi:DNA-binding CsgD family transcriptional regulator
MLLRVVSTDTASTESLLRQRLGLTAREAEVLLWISRGKSNRDISDILGMRPSTVTKHLEQIYIKLGVENRASAATVAVRVTSSG